MRGAAIVLGEEEKILNNNSVETFMRSERTLLLCILHIGW